MNKLLLFIFTLLLMFSCRIHPLNNVDSSKIIGKKFDLNLLPYGRNEDGIFDRIFINGLKHSVFAVYYKNRILVYVYNNDGYINNYFFSSAVEYEKVIKLFPIGTDLNEVIKKLGNPFESYFLSDLDNSMERNDYLNHISVIYLQLTFSEPEVIYFISRDRVSFIFDHNQKLLDIGIMRSLP